MDDGEMYLQRCNYFIESNPTVLDRLPVLIYDWH
jgi:hypothetical protein